MGTDDHQSIVADGADDGKDDGREEIDGTNDGGGAFRGLLLHLFGPRNFFARRELRFTGGWSPEKTLRAFGG